MAKPNHKKIDLSSFEDRALIVLNMQANLTLDFLLGNLKPDVSRMPA